MSTNTKEDNKLSPLKRALIAVKDMRAKLEVAERATKEPIAIVGIACVFPKAGGLQDYWANVRNSLSPAKTAQPSEPWHC